MTELSPIQERSAEEFPLKIQRGIDKITDFFAWIGSFILLFIMGIAVLEVVLRYLFNKPTNWAWGVNVQLFALTSMLSCAASYHHGYFINVEIFYKRFSRGVKVPIHLILFLFAAALSIVLIWQGWEAFYLAWQTNEHYTSYYQPPSYPVKFLVPLGGLFLLMQSVAELIRFFVSTENKEGEP